MEGPESLQGDSETNPEKSPTVLEKLSDMEKWRIAFIIGIIFIIMVLPVSYGFSNSIFSYVGLSTANKNGRPTAFGFILHALIFVIIIRVLMA